MPCEFVNIGRSKFGTSFDVIAINCRLRNQRFVTQIQKKVDKWKSNSCAVDHVFDGKTFVLKVLIVRESKKHLLDKKKKVDKKLACFGCEENADFDGGF